MNMKCSNLSIANRKLIDAANQALLAFYAPSSIERINREAMMIDAMQVAAAAIGFSLTKADEKQASRQEP